MKQIVKEDSKIAVEIHTKVEGSTVVLERPLPIYKNKKKGYAVWAEMKQRDEITRCKSISDGEDRSVGRKRLCLSDSFFFSILVCPKSVVGGGYRLSGDMGVDGTWGVEVSGSWGVDGKWGVKLVCNLCELSNGYSV
ncbi:hypothetical protein L1987_49733 [Smallanthus sonchifolius]|uniref:Uncharacterized protein n=1 Tax=Smallanthus sonchifolius TaxID=185202 RepID=A0ACB9FUX3_9ASTR|nr:hypothetical protein L1987_49733 [Smallanthus sonchifolius]